MQIPDDVAAELGQALARARVLIPAAWIKREGGRLDAAVAFQGVYELANKAGLIPDKRPRQSATIHAFPAPDAAQRQENPAPEALQRRVDLAPGETAPPS